MQDCIYYACDYDNNCDYSSDAESTHSSSKGSDTKVKLFISGIPPNYRKDQVQRLFLRLGYVKYIERICVFRGKGCGYVIVSPATAADDVIRGTNGKMINDQFKLSIRIFHERQKQKHSKMSKAGQTSDSQKTSKSKAPKVHSMSSKSLVSKRILKNLPNSQAEAKKQPKSSVKHQSDDLTTSNGNTSCRQRTRHKKHKAKSKLKPPQLVNKSSDILQGEINEHTCGENIGSSKSSASLSKSLITDGDEASESSISVEESFEHLCHDGRELDAPKEQCHFYGESITSLTESSEVVQESDKITLNQSTHTYTETDDMVGNSTHLIPIEDNNFQNCPCTSVRSHTRRKVDNECELFQNDSQPTEVVFHVKGKTDRTSFMKYVRHHLQNTPGPIEFEVKKIVEHEDDQTSEVTVQFQSLHVANLTLTQLQECPDIVGQIYNYKPKKSSTERVLNKKIKEFNESIHTKKAQFLAKHEKKFERLTSEHRKLSLPPKCSIDKFQDITARRNVLNQAIIECDRQKNEFTNYCTGLLTKLSKLEDDVKLIGSEGEEMLVSEEVLSEELSKLRKTFGIECIRLEKALPMYAYKSDIVNVIQTQNRQVIILIGETGSGKSTQLVQYLLDSGLAKNGIIVCTQPRKVAAISLAKHVSNEMGVALGQVLGYKTGLISKGSCSDKTRVIYMTDHSLLNECIADPLFSKYSCLVIDEAHERSLNTDLLLAFIKKCLHKRPDLKVIITSATIDPYIFDNYFGGGCPIINVPGRTYPVEVIWNPLKSDKSPLERNYVSDAVDVACRLHESEPLGDILVFLTSAAEIEKACQSTTNKLGNSALVLPLHGKLTPDEQQKVFQYDEQRKIVFATNVAETSVTIPGVKYIVDTGLAKELCFDAKKNMNSLEVRIISKSSAEQRKGRAGRTSAGKCYRLYSEAMYDEMLDKSLPEILRVTLETTALKLHEFGIRDVLSFDFVEEPDRAALKKAVENLEFLEAIKDGYLTDLGRQMAALPIDPHLSKILLDGINWGVGLEAAVSAAISTLAGSVFFRAGTDEVKQESDMKTITFCHPAGDQMTYLYAYFQWVAQDRANQNQWCVEHYVNAKSMRMVREVVKEFRDILRIKFNVVLEDRPFSPEIAEEVLPKLYFDTYTKNVCIYLGHERRGYLNSNLPDERLFLFHGSPLRQLNVVPKILVYEKTLVTSQHFLLQALPVKEEWLYEAIEAGKIAYHPQEGSLYKEHCVLPVAVSNLGKFCLKQLQKSWQKSKGNPRDIVKEVEPETEFDFKQGVVKVFVPSCHRGAISKVLTTDVSKLKAELREEVCEKGITKDDDNVRVVLKYGAAVKHVLMPDQYRTLVFNGPSVSRYKDEIVHTLRSFGAIETVNSNSHHQLFVSFSDPASASKAQSSFITRLKLPEDIKLQPCIPYKRSYDDLSAFTLHVEWCRRARQQYAFVNFKNEEDFLIAAQRLSAPSYCYASPVLRFMKIRPSKDGSPQLFVTNVKVYLTEDQIKEAMHVYLPEVSRDKFEVKVGYEKSFETTPEQLRELKEELDRLVAPYSTHGKYSISMNQHKNFFKTYKAKVKFENPDEGYKTMKHIQFDCIKDKELSVKAELSSTVRYSPKVYNAVENSIQEVTQEIHRRYKSVKVDHGKQDDKGRIIVRITSEDINTFIIAKHALSSVILPYVFDRCIPEICEFIRTANCKRALEKIESETSTFIRLDVRRPAISIYGNESNKSRAMIEFNKCLSFLDAGKKCFEIRLKEPGRPPGLMKHLVSIFGSGLRLLEEREGVTTIRLEPKRQIVTMFATEEDYKFLVDKIEEFSKSVDPVHHHRVDEIECCVCFAVIINPNELFRLESCGHTYCIDCFKTQIAPSTVDFPIECAADGCAEAIVWRDLYNISELTDFNIRHVVNASVKSYVAANQDKVRNCPTPDCSMIYSITKDGKCFFCHQCGAIVCTTCHEPYHEGVTCSMYQSGKIADMEFEAWLQEDRDNRKRCPRCSSPIEKDYGCNHVACRQCKAHICWFCLDCFRSSAECYDHMSIMHEGFGL